jgi:hypothetical protein
MKTVTLPQFLTAAQIAEAVRLYKLHGDGGAAVDRIHDLVIVPNIAAINDKLGQLNDSRYLAYMVLYALLQSSKEPAS